MDTQFPKELFAVPQAKWEELDKFVLELKDKENRHVGLFEAIEKKPITINSFNHLLAQGLDVKLSEKLRSYGVCFFNNMRFIIKLRKDLEPYERDKTLFHELVHAHYGSSYTNDSIRVFELEVEDFKLENAVIVEWLARQLRADPKLLRHVSNSFGLEQHIYDRASAQAFHPAFNGQRQLLFDFGKEHYEDLRKEYLKMPVLMD